MKKKRFSSNFKIYWNFRVFLLIFFYILVNNTNLLNYWSSLCQKQGVVVVGHNLYLHIFYLFLITLSYTLLIFFKGFVFFLSYFIGSIFFLIFYLKSFNLYTDYSTQGSLYIEIPSDLLCRLFLFFIPVAFSYEYVVRTKYKYRSMFIFFIIFFFFFLFQPFKIVYDCYSYMLFLRSKNIFQFF